MKKSLIALAVAGALTAPVVAQADATLYGKAEGVLQFVENKDANLFMDDVQFGITGSNETNIDGVSAIYKMEVELNETTMSGGIGRNTGSENSSITTRYAYAGLTGGFGTVLIGRIANPADVVEGYFDNSNKAGNFAYNPDRLGNAVAYVSPTMSGFNVYGGLVIQGENDDTTADTDGYVIGGNYEMGDLSLSVGYWNFADDGAVGNKYAVTQNVDNVLVGGSYTIGGFTIGAGYEAIDVENLDADLWGVAVSYAAGDLTPYLQYANMDNDDGISSDVVDASGDEWAVGLNYALGGKASVGAEYSTVDYDAAGSASVDQFNVSYTVKF